VRPWRTDAAGSGRSKDDSDSGGDKGAVVAAANAATGGAQALPRLFLGGGGGGGASAASNSKSPPKKPRSYLPAQQAPLDKPLFERFEEKFQRKQARAEQERDRKILQLKAQKRAARDATSKAKLDAHQRRLEEAQEARREADEVLAAAARARQDIQETYEPVAPAQRLSPEQRRLRLPNPHAERRLRAMRQDERMAQMESVEGAGYGYAADRNAQVAEHSGSPPRNRGVRFSADYEPDPYMGLGAEYVNAAAAAAAAREPGYSPYHSTGSPESSMGARKLSPRGNLKLRAKVKRELHAKKSSEQRALDERRQRRNAAMAYGARVREEARMVPQAPAVAAPAYLRPAMGGRKQRQSPQRRQHQHSPPQRQQQQQQQQQAPFDPSKLYSPHRRQADAFPFQRDDYDYAAYASPRAPRTLESLQHQQSPASMRTATWVARLVESDGDEGNLARMYETGFQMLMQERQEAV
jgi:hypothetical protein